MSNQPQKSYRFIQPTEAPADLNETAWRRARAAIDKLKQAYVEDWAPTSLDEIERALQMAASAPDGMAEHLDAVHRLAHDMKGQGATFGFALISDIGAALGAMTFQRADATPSELNAMLAHVGAARTVLAKTMEDPGCPEAVALMGKLKAEVRASMH